MKLRPALNRFRFFVIDAWDEWKHSPGANLLAVATLATSLFLAGLVVLILFNLEIRARGLRDEARVEVYLHDAATEAERGEIERSLRSMDGVLRVRHIDKAEAFRRYRAWAGEMAELIEELPSNPLPASLEVHLEPGPQAEERAVEISRSLTGVAGVEEVYFDRAWLRRLESLLALGRVGGTGLVVLVFAAVVFVMASVLRLAVYARRDDIEIMLLVGATPSFVRGPFMVAGFGQGLLSSGLALLLVEGVRRGALGYARSNSLLLLDLIASRPLSPALSLLLIGVGLIVSLAGSYFAVRRSV